MPQEQLIEDIVKWFSSEQKIITYPNEMLKKLSKYIFTKQQPLEHILRPVFDRMFEIMYSRKGVGLAAPQVGLPWRLFVMNTTGKPENKDKELVFINPFFSGVGNRMATNTEGCLSVPGVIGNVERFRKVKLEYVLPSLDRVSVQYEGLHSRAVQHEIDHLNGILFYERMTIEEKNKIALDAKLAELRS